MAAVSVNAPSQKWTRCMPNMFPPENIVWHVPLNQDLWNTSIFVVFWSAVFSFSLAKSI